MTAVPPRSASGQAACADRFYAPILPIILELHQQGLSLHQIAAELERRKVPTRNLMRWSASQIGRVLDRAGVARTKRPRSDKRSAAAASGVADAHVQQRQPADGVPVGQPNARPPEPPPPAAAAPCAQVPMQAEPADIGLFLGGKPCGPFTRTQAQAMLDAGTATVDTPSFRNVNDVWAPLGKLLGTGTGAAAASQRSATGPATAASHQQRASQRAGGPPLGKQTATGDDYGW